MGRVTDKNMNVDKLKQKKGDIVKESNTIARAQLQPPNESVWEERIIAQVAALNRMSDEDFPEQAFMIGQLTEKHIDGRTLTAIKNACQRLIGTYFKIHYSNSRFRLYSVFRYIEYDNGIISAQFNSDLKPFYLQLKREFSMRSLPEFQRLSSAYSQQIYRLLCSYRALDTAEIPIERLHDLTNAPKSFKIDFRSFRRRVLEPAEKEINAKTNLKFTWEPIRQGRKTIAVRFIFASGAAASAADRAAAAEVANENEELRKWQRLSNTCWERHFKAGTTCSPRGGNKCTYCKTRGRMAFKDAR